MKTVILAAGFGSRLWPLSTSEKPKQFQPLINGTSLLGYTYDTMRAVLPAEDIYVVGLAGMENLIREAVPGIQTDHILLVPERRNTLPHTLWSVASIAADTHEPILFKSVDHYITNPDDFHHDLRAALNAYQVDSPALTLLCSGFQEYNSNDGYCIADDNGAVLSFLEKPTREAFESAAEGHTVYRSPLTYIASKQALLDALDEIDEGWTTDAATVLTGDPEARRRAFLDLPFLDISSAIFQHSKALRVAEVAYDFVDVGRFEEIYALNGKDADGNAVIGDVIFGTPCRNNLVINKTDVPLVIIDKNDTVIVQTSDGSLISSFEQAAKIGEVYKSRIHARPSH